MLFVGEVKGNLLNDLVLGLTPALVTQDLQQEYDEWEPLPHFLR